MNETWLHNIIPKGSKEDHLLKSVQIRTPPVSLKKKKKRLNQGDNKRFGENEPQTLSFGCPFPNLAKISQR